MTKSANASTAVLRNDGNARVGEAIIGNEALRAPNRNEREWFREEKYDLQSPYDGRSQLGKRESWAKSKRDSKRKEILTVRRDRIRNSRTKASTAAEATETAQNIIEKGKFLRYQHSPAQIMDILRANQIPHTCVEADGTGDFPRTYLLCSIGDKDIKDVLRLTRANYIKAENMWKRKDQAFRDELKPQQFKIVSAFNPIQDNSNWNADGGTNAGTMPYQRQQEIETPPDYARKETQAMQQRQHRPKANGRTQRGDDLRHKNVNASGETSQDDERGADDDEQTEEEDLISQLSAYMEAGCRLSTNDRKQAPAENKKVNTGKGPRTGDARGR